MNAMPLRLAAAVHGKTQHVTALLNEFVTCSHGPQYLTDQDKVITRYLQNLRLQGSHTELNKKPE